MCLLRLIRKRGPRVTRSDGRFPSLRCLRNAESGRVMGESHARGRDLCPGDCETRRRLPDPKGTVSRRSEDFKRPVYILSEPRVPILVSASLAETQLN